MTARIKFEPYQELNHGLMGCQRVYKFPNGYGASVVQGPYSYGGENGLWELAITKFTSDDGSTWEICYKTPISNGVVGWLSEEGVRLFLKRIKRLKKRD
jgi:hypothetical protein